VELQFERPTDRADAVGDRARGVGLAPGRGIDEKQLLLNPDRERARRAEPLREWVLGAQRDLAAGVLVGVAHRTVVLPVGHRR
jgi:hypothetical protein